MQKFIDRLKSCGYPPDIAYMIVNDFVKERNYTGLNDFFEIAEKCG